MSTSLYSAASAMEAALAYQRILAHNIANLNTPGYRAIAVSFDEFLRTQYNGQTAGSTPVAPFGNELGLGVQLGQGVTSFLEGSLQQTGNPLDFAISGDGFFHVQTPDGDRYTRDGRFLRNATGQLVTVDGHPVLDTNAAPITLPEGEVSLGPDGTLSVDGTRVAQLGIAAFAQPATDLVRGEGNLFTAQNPPTGAFQGSVSQGYVEGSNADAAQLTTQMMQLARFYEAAQTAVKNQDDLLGRTLSTLGNV
jgi:flagellar basal body rod protein FlgG